MHYAFLSSGGMSSVVAEIIATMGAVTESLTKAPLSYFLYAGVAGIAISLFAKLRRSA